MAAAKLTPARTRRAWLAYFWLLASPVIAAQSPSDPTTTLPRNRFRSGEETLRAFAPIAAMTRDSIVKLNVNGETVALGAIMDTNGLALTKASEIKAGKLTCWLGGETEVPAEVLATDAEEDVALVKVSAGGLKPIQWADGEVALGQWAITPGVAETPHAVGIVSALPRRIRPQRAFIGIEFEPSSASPVVRSLMDGLGAEKAGLKPGDVITAVNGTSVTNREQVIETVREFREGQTLKLRFRRGDDELDADVRLMVPRVNRLAGDLSQRAEGFAQAIEHDTVLQPWLCGGPLVNLDGKAIGLNIARAGRVSTYALPAKLVREIFEQLKASLAKGALQ
jgi:serine protease Do